MQELSTFAELEAVVKGFITYYEDKAKEELIICHPIEKSVFFPLGTEFIPDEAITQAVVADTLICSADGKIWTTDFKKMFERDHFFVSDLAMKTYMEIEGYMYEELVDFLTQTINNVGIISNFRWKDGQLGELEFITFQDYLFSHKYDIYETNNEIEQLDTPTPTQFIDESDLDHEDFLLFKEDNPDQATEVESTLRFIGTQLISSKLPYNQYKPSRYSNGTGIRSLLKRFKLDLDEQSAIAYYSTKYSDWIFTFSGFIVRYADKNYHYLYKDIVSVYNTGVVTEKIKINTRTDGDREISLHPASQNGCQHAILRIIKEAKEAWTSLLNHLPSPNFLEDVFHGDPLTIDKAIFHMVQVLQLENKIYQLSYATPTTAYANAWTEANAAGFPDQESLTLLSQLKDELKLKINDIEEIEKPLRLKHYRNELYRLQEEDWTQEQLTEELEQLKDIFGINNDEARIEEENILGAAFSGDYSQFSFVEVALEVYAEQGEYPFGNKFYPKQAIPEEKMRNVKNKYLQSLDRDETVIFLYDDTMFGSAKDGFVFTNKHIYTSKKEIIELNRILSFKLDDYKWKIQTTASEFEITLTQFSNREAFVTFMEYLTTNRDSTVQSANVEGNVGAYEETVEEEITAEQVTQYLEMEVEELKKQAVRLGDKKIGVLESIDPTKLKKFLKLFNKKNKTNIQPDEIIGYYDNTVFGKGDDGFAVLTDGICSTMKGTQGFHPFNQMIDDPEFKELLNSKIFLYLHDGKKEFYCTGAKGPKIIFELIELFYNANQLELELNS